MPTSHGQPIRGALFLAFGAGGVCFLFSLVAMILFGIATGIESVGISFSSLSQHHLDWWEIVSLSVSLAVSTLTSQAFFRYLQKFI